MPNGVVTWTSTVPAVPGGATTVSRLAVLTEIDVPGFAPKSTALAPVRNVPTTVTVLPPASGPELGSTAPTEVWGAATEVEAMATAGLVQVSVTGKGRPTTVRVSVPLAAAVTDADPAALPAVKLSAGPLAVSLVPAAGLGIDVAGTVSVVAWVAGVAPETETDVV